MKKRICALIVSLALAVGLLPGLAIAEPGDGPLTAEATETGEAVAMQATKTPKVTVKRVANGKLAMKVGTAYKLGAKTTVGKLTYKISNKKVATVTSKGTVKALKAGKATITVTAKNGTKKASKKVSLKVLSAKKFKPVKKVTAKASATSLLIGEAATVKATLSPSKPSNKNLIYTSSNKRVLTVSATGKIKALDTGIAKVTVKSCSNAKAKASVTIVVLSDRLLNRSKWKARMKLPTVKQIGKYPGADKSPYMVCWPQFKGVEGFTEYAVDVKADSQPRGTYVNVANWWMDVSSLKAQYAKVYGDDEDDTPGAGYAGFQVLEDGSKVAIMSIWKVCLEDKNGKKSTFNANRTYPEKARVADDFGGEGTGVKTIVDYDGQAGKTYRTRIQTGKTSKGNCELTFSVRELPDGEWTKLVSYDLGYESTSMTGVGCFLENYLPVYAGEIRTAEWSNYRVKSLKSDSWVSAKSAKMERQFADWPGSYNYGSDDSCFWAITSGVKDLCDPPKNLKEFTVSKVEEGEPK